MDLKLNKTYLWRFFGSYTRLQFRKKLNRNQPI